MNSDDQARDKPSYRCSSGGGSQCDERELQDGHDVEWLVLLITSAIYILFPIELGTDGRYRKEPSG